MEARWLTASQAIQLHRQDLFFMAPPTFITLLEIESISSAQELWDMAQLKEVVEIQPIHDKSIEPMQICFPGHPNHSKSQPTLPFTSVFLQNLHWEGQ